MADNIPEGFVDISKKQDGGVLKKILREGTSNENPSTGDEVYVHYVGTLFGGDNDGEKFDSSRDRNSHFNFKLGEGHVIKAWDEGVATMKKGELCELICKPDYAYGASGSPPKIPPNATLKFEVELFKWQGEDLTEDKDGGVTRCQIHAGLGYRMPSLGSSVIIQVQGKLANETTFFDERDDVKFDLGDGSEHNICSGIELALKKMKKGERSRLYISPKYGFSLVGKSEWNVPPNADIIYEVSLKDFEEMVEPYDLKTMEEKVAQAQILKEKGTNYFKKNNFKLASHFYESALPFLREEDTSDNEDESNSQPALVISIRLNLALCMLKTDQYSKCVEECDRVLTLEPKNEKALFRKAQAEFARHNYELAQKLYFEVSEVNPENKAAQQQAHVCQQKVKALLQKEKDMCRNMFSKLGKPDKSEGDKPTDSTTNGVDSLNNDCVSV